MLEGKLDDYYRQKYNILYKNENESVEGERFSFVTAEIDPRMYLQISMGKKRCVLLAKI